VHSHSWGIVLKFFGPIFVVCGKSPAISEFELSDFQDDSLPREEFLIKLQKLNANV